MKNIVMLVCVCAFGLATFAGCKGELKVSTPDPGSRPALTTNAPGGGGNTATILD